VNANGMELACTGLVYSNLGIPTLYGYAAILCLIPLQVFFGKRFSVIRRNTIKWTDLRIKFINEILTASSVMKMYNWEKSLEKFVYSARDKEFKSVSSAGRLRSTNLGLFFAALPLIALVTFGGQWLAYDQLTTATLFTTLAFFNLVRTPLTSFMPNAIERLMECRIASERVDEFMQLSSNLSKQEQNEGVSSEEREKEKEQERRAASPIAAGEIKIENASFIWDKDKLPQKDAQGNIIAGRRPTDSTEQHGLQRQESTVSELALYTSAPTTPRQPGLRRESTGTSISSAQQHAQNSSGITLENISLNVRQGDFVGVVGQIGAGKSSLLAAILDEMTCLTGVINSKGRIAYASQNAWIFAGTVRDNILFGNQFDMDRYKQTIIACCLLDDLKQFHANDLTEIGEKGVNLSGGQVSKELRSGMELLSYCLSATCYYLHYNLY